MHILIIPPGIFLTEKNPVNGIFQYEQALALKDAGHNVSIFSVAFLSARHFFTSYDYSSYEKINGVSIYRKYEKLFIPFRVRSIANLVNKLYILSEALIAKYIEKHGKPDIIHAHNVLFSGILAEFINKKHSIPFVVTEHSSAFLRGMVPSDLDKKIKDVYNSANNISCVSQSFKKILEDRYELNFEILPNILGSCFLDNNFIFEKKIGFSFVNVAMLNENKNHKLLIKAFSNKFSGKDVKLKIIGDGPMLSELTNYAKENGISDQLIFLGQRSSEYIKNELLNSNCFVFSSNHETFGVSLIEALSCGLPLISTRNGGGEDIVNDSNGFLVSVGNVEEMGDAMESVYLNSFKYDRQYLRNQAISKYGRFAFLKNINKLYKI